MRDLQRDFAVGVHVRRNVDIDADVEILELRIHQRVDADAANAGLERSGGNRHAVADLQRGLLPIQRANLRILNQFGVAVAHHCRQVGGGNRDLEVGGVEVAQSVQVDASSSGAGGYGSTGSEWSYRWWSWSS